MSYLKLLKACDQFNKAAQAKQKQIVIDPKKKNIDFWSKFLYSAIKSYALKFNSPKAAKNVFDNIAAYNRSSSYMSDKEAKDVDSIDAALKEAASKLTSAGIDPVKVLKQKGMANVNPNILSILHSNLETIRAAQDFNKYQHYYLQPPGESKEIIEIDENVDNSPGY